MLGLDTIKNDLVKLEEYAKNRKQLKELGLLFARITNKWEKARKELDQL
jgi:hypothetical protein